jgi:hypothetical protein
VLRIAPVTRLGGLCLTFAASVMKEVQCQVHVSKLLLLESLILFCAYDASDVSVCQCLQCLLCALINCLAEKVCSSVP